METPPTSTPELWHAVLAAIGAGAMWAWKFVTGNIKELRTTSVTKDEFNAYTERSQKQRDELREAVVKLFDSHTGLRADMVAMHRDIIDRINAK